MPSIVVKSVPPSLHRQLKEAAARHRRSMNQQALAMLEEALRHQNTGAEPPPALAGRFPLTPRWIQQAKRRGRP